MSDEPTPEEIAQREYEKTQRCMACGKPLQLHPPTKQFNGPDGVMYRTHTGRHYSAEGVDQQQ